MKDGLSPSLLTLSQDPNERQKCHQDVSPSILPRILPRGGHGRAITSPQVRRTSGKRASFPGVCSAELGVGGSPVVPGGQWGEQKAPGPGHPRHALAKCDFLRSGVSREKGEGSCLCLWKVKVPALSPGVDQALPMDPTQACPHGLPQCACACVCRIRGSRMPQDRRRRGEEGRRGGGGRRVGVTGLPVKADQTQPKKDLVSSSPRPGHLREGGDRGGMVTQGGHGLLEGREGRARAGPRIQRKRTAGLCRRAPVPLDWPWALEKVWASGGRAAGWGPSRGWAGCGPCPDPVAGAGGPPRCHRSPARGRSCRGLRPSEDAQAATVGVRTREERTMHFHSLGFYLQGKENFSLDCHCSLGT